MPGSTTPGAGPPDPTTPTGPADPTDPFAPVPEPSSLAIIGGAAVWVLVKRTRRLTRRGRASAA
ncbi:PEP-CTERM sorting domain-containing protein [Roseimaritima ulvae]|uniref:PEP-CTERM sorting domain-containing protein n=1 Tax=Roseimaritima ulvae TaxID=980254 RepID=UPI00138FD4A5|nr:PEP-CTERM sorting domain-containing protein [Roseimaritima ulvae]